MIHLSEAQKQIIETTSSIVQTQEIGLLDAIGSVLAHPITALLDQPPFTNAAMDGYAVRYEDVRMVSDENPIQLQVTSFQSAGTPPCILEPKTAVEIST